VPAIRRVPTIWKEDLHKGVEVVTSLVFTVVVEVEVPTTKENTEAAIKATVVVEEAAEAFSPDDPLPTPKKNPSNSRESTISIKLTKNSKKCWKNYRKVQSRRNPKTENPINLQLSWKKAKLNLQPTTNLPHLCPKTSMTRRSLSLTPFPAKLLKNQSPVLDPDKIATQNLN
jgi:hypothetical protein